MKTINSENNLILKKPSAMIQTNVKRLSLAQRKVLNFFIYILQNEKDKKFYTTSIKHLKKTY